MCCRDSDASAPAEFPPDQPEADLIADGEEYGAEEAEEEDEEELGEGAEGAAATDPDVMAEDSEMAGAEIDPTGAPGADGCDEGSGHPDAGSSGSEEEYLEEDGAGEGDGDESMELC